MLLLFAFLIVDSLEPRFYAGRDFSIEDAEIVRDKTSKNAIFKFNRSLSFSLYSGNTIETIDLSTPILKGVGPGNFTLVNVPKTRIYFQLFTNEGKALLSDHHLPLGFNFRDMGGIQTKSGRHIKYGTTFRTDEIVNLTDEDIAYLNSIPIKTVVDFRSEGEKEEAPDVRVSDVYLDYPIGAGNLAELVGKAMEGGSVDSNILIMGMVDMYKGFVTEPEVIETYKKFFEALQNPESTPIIWHCTAGKDRAGTATILFLSSLGVNRERILKDYLESNKYLEAKYGGMPSYLKPLFDVTEQYFQGLIDAIEENYGSVEEFLTGRLDVNLNEMKRLYLE